MKVVIMAGGKGTRIASINKDVPKPMIPILGKPILEYQIEALKKQGLTEFILVVGHLASMIKDYFQDGRGGVDSKGKDFDVDITYITEEEPLGSAGALYLLKNQILEDKEEDFLLINGDIIFDFAVQRFVKSHKENHGLATIFTHPNNHPFDSGVILADEQGKVTGWLHKEEPRLWYQNRVNAGIHLLSKRIFLNKELSLFHELKKLDLDRDVLKPMISTNQLFVYDSPEYVKDMGTPDRYHAVIRDIQSGLPERKNLSHLQRAIFLDRDGTINKYVHFLNHIEDFELIDGVSDAIRKINESGYLAIVITNQPVIARGEVTREELRNIHNKMETLLGVDGAYVNAIYYCPHHPDRGFAGEVSELKIQCDCRKPKPGLLLQAAKDFNIDLTRSYMIGDSRNDIGAGLAASCKVAYISDEQLDGVDSYHSLKECIDDIL